MHRPYGCCRTCSAPYNVLCSNAGTVEFIVDKRFTLDFHKHCSPLSLALMLCIALSCRNAGTVEFIVDKHGKHYYMETNPR